MGDAEPGVKVMCHNPQLHASGVYVALVMVQGPAPQISVALPLSFTSIWPPIIIPLPFIGNSPTYPTRLPPESTPVKPNA